jgi:hypothetical protein
MASPPPAVQHAQGVAPYHPPPNYPPPAAQTGQVTDGHAAASVVFAVLGFVFAIPLGLPGMIAGPIAYFLGKSARTRIAESNGALGGEGAANIGRILGIVTFTVGCVVTFLWLLVVFNAMAAGSTVSG